MATPDFATKGTHAIRVREWVDAKLGEGAFLAGMREHDPEWPDRLVPLNWYAIRPMLSVLSEALGEGESVEGVVTKIAGINAEQDLRSIYKAFLWVGSPASLFKMTKTVWGSYSTIGAVEVIDNQSGNYEAWVSEVPKDLLDWCTGCWLGFVPTAAGMAGAKNAQASIVAREPIEDRWRFHFRVTHE